jgi:hypothetical protein
MATKRQIAANRRNAKKCTGPKTPEGKAASSMNALRHGLRARKVVLPDEKPEEFDEIFTGLQDQFQPQNPGEQYLVDQAAIAQWKLVRAEVYQARSREKDPSIEACSAVFCKMTLVTGRLERTYSRAYKELERIKAARGKQRVASEEQPEKLVEKAKKSQEPDMPSGIRLYWVNPETGERTLAAHTPGAGDPDDPTRAEQSAEPPTPPI